MNWQILKTLDYTLLNRKQATYNIVLAKAGGQLQWNKTSTWPAFANTRHVIGNHVTTYRQMFVLKCFILTVFLFSLNGILYSQARHSAECFQVSFSDAEEHIFTKMGLPPSYAGGDDKLRQRLITNINFNKIMDSLSSSTRYLIDTISVKFIIGKLGVMSNLEIEKSLNANISAELFHAFKSTACYWRPGSSGGRSLNGWYHALLVFEVDRRGSFLAMRIELVK